MGTTRQPNNNQNPKQKGGFGFVGAVGKSRNASGLAQKGEPDLEKPVAWEVCPTPPQAIKAETRNVSVGMPQPLPAITSRRSMADVPPRCTLNARFKVGGEWGDEGLLGQQLNPINYNP